MIRLFLILCCLITLVSCSAQGPAQLMLFDFESDEDLDNIHWQCHTLFSLSDAYVTHGAKSLCMELYPSDYPGLTPKLPVNNWRQYRAVFFDIYNPQDNPAPIVVRIDDQKEHSSYADRYNKRFVIKPGANRISIPFDSLVTSGTGRLLNLKNIYRFLIFMGHPDKKFIFYIDYIHLVP